MIFFITLFLATSTTQASETRKVMLTDRTIEAVIDLPKVEGPHPLLIIAPGRNEKLEEPIYKSIADSATKLGWVAIRFNWGFRKTRLPTARTSLSTDFKNEAEDLSTMLTSFTQGRVNEPLEINKELVALMTDGFSARASMIADSDALKPGIVKAHLYLNPECEAGTPFTKAYSNLLAVKTPRLLVSNRTPGSCDFTQFEPKLFGETFSVFLMPPSTSDLKSRSTPVTAVITDFLQSLGWKNKPHKH